MSFTLSNSEDMAHTSSDSDTKLTSNDTMNTQSKKSDDEVHVTSMKNAQKPFNFVCCHTEQQASW